MRLLKVVPLVGFSAVSFLSSPAMCENNGTYRAAGWGTNNQCLEVTAVNGVVTVNLNLCSSTNTSQNLNWNGGGSDSGDGNYPGNLQSGGQTTSGYCLDMNNVSTVAMNPCQTSQCPGPACAQGWVWPGPDERGVITNKYTGWSNGQSNCLIADGTRQGNGVSAAPCNPSDPMQQWGWYSAATAVVSTEPSSDVVDGEPVCSIPPVGGCVAGGNICGNPSYCVCPVGYIYNSATAKCDWSF